MTPPASAPETDAGLVQPEARRLLRDALLRGSPVCVRNTGASMAPTLLPGDLLTVEPVARRPPRPGDLVLLEAGGDWVVHRFLAVPTREGEAFAVTRGDAVGRLDDPLPLACVLGVVVRVRRDEREWPVPPRSFARVRAGVALAGLALGAATQRFRVRLAGGPAPGKRNAAAELLRWSLPAAWSLDLPARATPVVSAGEHAGPPAYTRERADPSGGPASPPAASQKADGSRAACSGPETTDWPRLLPLTEREGLAPLLYHQARASGRESVFPAPVLARLTRGYHEVLARNTLFLERLAVFIRAMGDRPVLVLKGACLAREVYPSPALRPFSDLDVLVRPGDLPEAARQLAGLGYRPFGDLPDVPVAEPGGLNSVLFQAGNHEPAFHVHGHLFNSTLPKYSRASLDLESLWTAARPCAEGGLSLAPEHLVIHLAEHALRHSYDRLILLRDLAEVIQRAGAALDWDRVAADSRAFGLARPVFYSLLLARDLAGAAVPGSALAALRPARRGLGERLFLGLVRRGRRGAEWSNLVYLADQPGWGARLAFLGRLLLPPRSVMARAQGVPPEAVRPGLYLRRLGRGLGQALGVARHRPDPGG